VVGFKAVDDVVEGAESAGKMSEEAVALGATACSFTGDTEVLMADGTHKPIKDMKIGEQVRATNPETGESGARAITTVWHHLDTVLDLATEGGIVLTTTEDHPFWNVTDQQWQQAQHLDPGDHLLAADGRRLRVVELRPDTIRVAVAYNLSVDDIHTYYVLAGGTPVLVHNAGPFCGVPFGKRTPGDANFHGSDFTLDEMVEFVRGHADSDNPAARRPSASQIEDALRNVGPVRNKNQNSARFDYLDVRVIINYDMPWRSTAYFPGR
jgi:hypothetical protein